MIVSTYVDLLSLHVHVLLSMSVLALRVHWLAEHSRWDLPTVIEVTLTAIQVVRDYTSMWVCSDDNHPALSSFWLLVRGWSMVGWWISLWSECPQPWVEWIQAGVTAGVCAIAHWMKSLMDPQLPRQRTKVAASVWLLWLVGGSYLTAWWWLYRHAFGSLWYYVVGELAIFWLMTFPMVNEMLNIHATLFGFFVTLWVVEKTHEMVWLGLSITSGWLQVYAYFWAS